MAFLVILAMSNHWSSLRLAWYGTSIAITGQQRSIKCHDLIEHPLQGIEYRTLHIPIEHATDKLRLAQIRTGWQ